MPSFSSSQLGSPSCSSSDLCHCIFLCRSPDSLFPCLQLPSWRPSWQEGFLHDSAAPCSFSDSCEAQMEVVRHLIDLVLV